MKRANLWSLLVLAIAAGLGACDSASQITAPETTREAAGPSFAFTIGEAETTIRAGGGHLRLGDHFLFVPRGAVQRPTTFRMETSGEGFGVELTAWDKDGPVTSFAKGLTLTLSYSDLDKDSAKLVRLEEDGSETDITVWDNTSAKRVWGVTDHFSDFIIVDW